MKILRLGLLGFFLCGNLLAATHTISGKVNVVDKDGKDVSDKEKIVVYLEPVGETKKNVKFDLKATTHSMASDHKAFKPNFITMVKGSTVKFPNNDTILHNVFSLSKAKTFDLGLYKKGEGESVTFDNSGVVKVYCNIHPKMAGYVVVLDNPLYSVTSKNGEFNIADIPKGEYKISTWHRFGKGSSQTIKVDKSLQALSLNLKSDLNTELNVIETNRNIKHKNKWGKPYKSKY